MNDTKETPGQPPSADRLPTFSILVETANLSRHTLPHLRECLDTLARQEVPPDRAREVLLLENGQVPPELLDDLRRSYPWLTVCPLEAGADYGAMKARSPELATGEVLLLCDSDCRFPPDWVGNILAPFAERGDIHIVAGETTTPIRSPYGLAMALTFVFPRFSRDRGLIPSRTYWANNVAVRRRTLLQMPIPDAFPVFRGQNIIHSARLSDLGHTIWRNPQARALHVLPGPRELPQRFFQLGQDTVNIRRFARDATGHAYRGDMEPDRMDGGRLRKLAARARTVFAENPWRLLFLPLAVPVMAVAAFCYHAGRLTALGRVPSVRVPSSSRAR